MKGNVDCLPTSSKPGKRKFLGLEEVDVVSREIKFIKRRIINYYG